MQHLHAGRLSKVQRGEYVQRLPTGLVRLSDTSVIKDPDQQIQHVIGLVLSKFEECGSAQVLRYRKQQEILLPRRHGNGVGPDKRSREMLGVTSKLGKMTCTIHLPLEPGEATVCVSNCNSSFVTMRVTKKPSPMSSPSTRITNASSISVDLVWRPNNFSAPPSVTCCGNKSTLFLTRARIARTAGRL